MNFDDADKLIDKFVDEFKIIESLETYFDVYSISDLPCSSGRLKYAHFLYAEHLVASGNLSKGMGNLLIKSYGYIARFLDKDDKIIEEINKENKVYFNNLKKNKFNTTPHLNEVNLRILEFTIEFNNYLADLQNKHYELNKNSE